MQTMPKDDFPTLPDLAAGAGVAINRKLLREMVVKTQFAITGEDTRYFLNGALFVVRHDAMMLVATDGHRLAIVTAPRDGDAKVEETRTILRRRRCRSWAGSWRRATRRSGSRGATATSSSASTGGCSCRG